MIFTEAELQEFAAPLSAAEDQKCMNAIVMVRDALEPLGFSYDNRLITKLHEGSYAYTLLMNNTEMERSIRILLQGSYANNTCVRMESDVDIAIIQERPFVVEYPQGFGDADYKIETKPPPAKPFKDEVYDCLKVKFGRDVQRKDKAIKVHGNTNRKDADTVPCKLHRDYRFARYIDADNYVGGIVFRTDNGEWIINYPMQHIENVYRKDMNTRFMFKPMVRIVKKIRQVMKDNRLASAGEMSSFGLESLLWNIPNSIYTTHTAYRFTFGETVRFMFANINGIHECKEANGIKQLCPTQAEIVKYQSFITDLAGFYQYTV